MKPLNKLPNNCMCSTVHCHFQQPSFFKDSIKKLLTDKKSFTEETETLRKGFTEVEKQYQRSHQALKEENQEQKSLIDIQRQELETMKKQQEETQARY